MPRKQPPVPAPAARGLTRKGEAGIADRDQEIAIDLQHLQRGHGQRSTDDSHRVVEGSRTAIGSAKTPVKSGGSRMKTDGNLPDEPVSAKRNPRVRGA